MPGWHAVARATLRFGETNLYIFVDESGNFAPGDGLAARVSCIAAIVVSSTRYRRLTAEYRAVRAQIFPAGGEPKGARLGEDEAQRVLALLARHDVLLDACVIDAGVHRNADVEQFQATLASSLVADLDSAKQPLWYVERMTRCSDAVARLSPQLFVQCWAMVNLIHRIVQTVTLHFARRDARELRRFRWVVDPKDVVPTRYEEAWTELILPLIAELTKRDPIVLASGANYAHLARFEKPIPVEALANLPAGQPWERKAVDFEALLQEVTFPRSENTPGLQLADMAASVLCRAFNQNIGRAAWMALPPLMRRDSRQRPVRLLRISPEGSAPAPVHPRYVAVVRQLSEVARWGQTVAE